MFIKILLITIVLIEGIKSCDFKQRNRNPRLSSQQISPNNTSFTPKFEEHAIVPDVIDEAPKEKAHVRYARGVEVDFGNELTPFSVKDQPFVSWPIESGQNYTLIMTDPDVPSRKEPTLGEVNHWLVINIPGKDLNEGETLASYRGSGPPEGSGLHRYIFLVYKQPSYLKHSETYTIPIQPANRDDRVNFKVRQFAKKYNLGQPVAGNFFQAEADEYIKQLAKKVPK